MSETNKDNDRSQVSRVKRASVEEELVPGIYSQAVIPHKKIVNNADQILYMPRETSSLSLDDEQEELTDDVIQMHTRKPTPE
jgi:hypothetical protein